MRCFPLDNPQMASVNEFLGVNFTAFGNMMPVWSHILILVGSGVLFYLLALLFLSHKKAHE